MSRNKLILGGIVIAVFLSFGLLSFRKTLTPYVTFAEARSAGRTVQVKGYPDHTNAHFDPDRRAFCFTMRDDGGESMNVVYRGPKPGNFEQAQSVVAIGRYQGDALESEQLLVKCPSKYESQYPGATQHPDSVPTGRGARLDATPMSAPEPQGRSTVGKGM